jgi:hypothetical protein
MSSLHSVGRLIGAIPIRAARSSNGFNLVAARDRLTASIGTGATAQKMPDFVAPKGVKTRYVSIGARRRQLGQTRRVAPA